VSALNRRRASRQEGRVPEVRPRCINCGQFLRRCGLREVVPQKQWGDYGDGHFCGLRCGYARLHAAMDEIATAKEPTHARSRRPR
jgi:hypothetical protein